MPNYKFKGLFWLFMGVANSDAKLYDDELSEIAATYPENFRVDYALSREQNNKRGGKMYIQDKVGGHAGGGRRQWRRLCARRGEGGSTSGAAGACTVLWYQTGRQQSSGRLV